MNMWGWLALGGGIVAVILLIVFLRKLVFFLEDYLEDHYAARFPIGLIIGLLFDFVWLIFMNKSIYDVFFPIMFDFGSRIEWGFELFPRFSLIWLVFAPALCILLSFPRDAYSFIGILLVPLLVLLGWGIAQLVYQVVVVQATWAIVVAVFLVFAIIGVIYAAVKSGGEIIIWIFRR